jgi:hypothetical protein
LTAVLVLNTTTLCDTLQPVNERWRCVPQPRGEIFARIVLLASQDDEAGERAVDDIGTLKCSPEVQWRRGTVDTETRLDDVPAFIHAVSVSILRAQEDAARCCIELGHVIEDLGDVPRASLPVRGGRQEHAELVDLEEDCRLPVECGQ